VKRYLLFLTGLYFVAHFWLPLNLGIYWDDWVWNLNPDEGQKAAWELGTPLLASLSVLFIKMQNGVLYYKTLIFLSYLIATLSVFYVLVRHRIFQMQEAFWICAIMAVYPVNNTRVAFSTGSYAFCYVLFALASVFLLNNKMWSKILSLPLFFISFFTNSFLVFYAVPVALHFYLLLGFNKNNLKKNIIQYCKSNWYVVILPPLFWISKKVFFPVHGLYASYNKIKVGGFVLNPLNWITVFEEAIIAPFYYLFDIVNTWSYHIVLAVIISCIFICVRKSKTHHLKTVFYSLPVLFLAAFPYLTVRKIPTFAVWDSRHQLLLSLFVGLFFFGVSRTLFKEKKWSHAFLILVLVFSILIQWKLYISFQRDWYKQQGLAQAMFDSPEFNANTTFEMEDVSPYWKPLYSPVAFYTYTGLMRKTFGDQKRFAAEKAEMEELFANSEQTAKLFIGTSRYNMADYKMTLPDFKVNYKVEEEKSVPRVLELLFQEWTDPEKLKASLRGLVQLDIQNVQSD